MRIEESQGPGRQNGHAQPANRRHRRADSRRNPRLLPRDADRRNPPSGGWSSTTASWCRGCATAPGSRPARSTRSAPICPSTGPLRRRAQGKPSPAAKPLNGAAAANAVAPPGFRFFDNRQKYLLFVSTCSEKTEVGQPDFARARQSAAGAAGAADFRCRRRRRHRAVAGDAGGACALSHHAALCRGQGDQLRRRPADAGEDGGPPVRASRHRAGRHQSLLRRGAVADAALGDVRRKA